MADLTFVSSRSLLACALGLSLAATAACSSDKDAGGAAGGSGSTGTTGATGGVTLGMSGATTGSGSADAGTDAGAVSSDTAMESGSFIDEPGDTGPAVPQPLGGMCDDPSGCESGFCYSIPMLGGVCSECLTDTDCETGTCALDLNAGFAACTDGSAGSMCDSDVGCMGELVCAELFDTGGVFPLNFCSECDVDLPCAGGQVCTPVVDVASLGGSNQCLDPMSVADGGSCPIGDGSVCVSGFCGTASAAGGFLEIGVCGACIVDGDCMGPGEMCVPPSAGMAGLTPAVCQ